MARPAPQPTRLSALKPTDRALQRVLIMRINLRYFVLRFRREVGLKPEPALNAIDSCGTASNLAALTSALEDIGGIEMLLTVTKGASWSN